MCLDGHEQIAEADHTGLQFHQKAKTGTIQDLGMLPVETVGMQSIDNHLCDRKQSEYARNAQPCNYDAKTKTELAQTVDGGTPAGAYLAENRKREVIVAGNFNLPVILLTLLKK